MGSPCKSDIIKSKELSKSPKQVFGVCRSQLISWFCNCALRVWGLGILRLGSLRRGSEFGILTEGSLQLEAPKP